MSIIIFIIRESISALESFFAREILFVSSFRLQTLLKSTALATKSLKAFKYLLEKW